MSAAPPDESDLRARVFERLDDAVAFGFGVASWPAEQLTDDLMTFDPIADRHERPKVLRAVAAWLRAANPKEDCAMTLDGLHGENQQLRRLLAAQQEATLRALRRAEIAEAKCAPDPMAERLRAAVAEAHERLSIEREGAAVIRFDGRDAVDVLVSDGRCDKDGRKDFHYTARFRDMTHLAEIFVDATRLGDALVIVGDEAEIVTLDRDGARELKAIVDLFLSRGLDF
jgi:hypothetical protein